MKDHLHVRRVLHRQATDIDLKYLKPEVKNGGPGRSVAK
jgi:hypothetical protein